MENKILKDLNTIPVSTFRWLKVNNISLNEEIDIPSVNYEREYCKFKETSDYSLHPIEKYNTLASSFSTDNFEGVSRLQLDETIDSNNCGFSLEVKANRTIEDLIYIDYELNSENPKVVDKNLIVLGEKSTVNVLIKYTSADESIYYHNGFTKIHAKKDSTVNIFIVQNLNYNTNHFNSLFSKVEEGAKINLIPIELGAKKAITNYSSDLVGDNSESTISSVYYGDADRLIDINFKMTHIGKKTSSNIDVKGVLADKSKKTFRGTLDFKTGSSKSKGSEEEYVMLLSKNARNNSIPLLLCSEHDVEGQHAASAGKIDEDALFYLMSRGISELNAKKLMIEGYLTPIIDKIPVDDLRQQLMNSVKDRLKNE
ncbi:Fe-S cluster assembly protein SufD [Clostridium folliculivorans]|uniref:Fe-S cluster assembly protein SufD n=1 Tax=Clostridium folliculivorans TaxID=2886038 RepID=A0A9W6D9J8_9CLOT|nr:Fe-S cluster assembly protein SufD [Clostridium folliculivorans]GKU23837.1 Fe-S cluster assembly protein SufD [Clostridium folliculivorans]GKU29953.1 Fe-S cluster assembly protein SufD [Clostridium folliculivorans]